MMLRKTTLFIIALSLSASAVRADDKVAFNRDIRPILTNACFKCHGPAVRKGGFRLDVRDEAVKPARSGAVPIVAGKAADSELVKRLFATEKDEVMPPPSTHKTLKPAEKELIKKWIDEGAVYQKHWSFEPPVKVALKTDGPANPIDRFMTCTPQERRAGPVAGSGSVDAHPPGLLRPDRSAAHAG